MNDLVKKRGHNLKGRQKGVKNKSTLFKEAVNGDFEKMMRKDFKKVMEVVIEQAIGGDMVAAKMIMERTIPRAETAELLQKGGLSININVASLEDSGHPAIVIQESDVLDVDTEDEAKETRLIN